MARKISTGKLTSNIIISVLAQAVSLATGFVLHLLVPKFIEIDQYALWQTMSLYISYVGVLHFGLLDGLVLRYSQYDFEELDKPRLRSQFQLLLFGLSAMGLLTCAVAFVFCEGPTKIIVLMVAAGILTKNLFTYNSYTFQLTNQINKYAGLVITQRFTYMVIVVLLIIFRVKGFVWYCAAELLGDFTAFFLSCFLNKGMYFGKVIPIKNAFVEARDNIKSGAMLMLATWSAILLLGSAKMIVEWRWDDLTFGKVSFAFSVTNLFLTFVTAISVVLFPSLKRIESDKLAPMYKTIRSVISPLLFATLALYYPGCVILELWLPKYAEGLTYLGMLLPMIVYSSKVSLLTNNYIKVYRLEKRMFQINIFSACFGLALFAAFAYLANSLVAIMIGVVFTVMLNSTVSEILVMKLIGIKFIKEFIIEGIMTGGFIVAVMLPIGRLYSFFIYLGLFTVYCIINYRSVVGMIKRLLGRVKKGGHSNE